VLEIFIQLYCKFHPFLVYVLQGIVITFLGEVDNLQTSYAKFSLDFVYQKLLKIGYLKIKVMDVFETYSVVSFRANGLMLVNSRSCHMSLRIPVLTELMFGSVNKSSRTLQTVRCR